MTANSANLLSSCDVVAAVGIPYRPFPITLLSLCNHRNYVLFMHLKRLIRLDRCQLSHNIQLLARKNDRGGTAVEGDLE